MEDRSSIEKNYINKIKEFKRHNKLYYDKNKPSIVDSDYDVLKKKILELENKYSYLSHKILLQKILVSNRLKYLKNKNTRFQCFHYQMYLTKMIC